jgi:hypothetical protein
MFVIDQMLQIAEQHGQDGLARLHEDGGHSSAESGILDYGEAFFDADAIDRNAANCVGSGAGLVDGEIAQLGEVRQPLGFHGRENGAESGQTIQQMAEEQFDGPSPRGCGLPIEAVCWKQPNQVYGLINLFLNLEQKRRTKRLTGVHPGFKFLVAAAGEFPIVLGDRIPVTRGDLSGIGIANSAALLFIKLAS